MRDPLFKKFGLILLMLGCLGMLAAAIIGYTTVSESDNGSLIAVSFLLVMLGISFCFPTLLEESEGQVSTMRIIVFAVTMVFCVIYIKLGWQQSSFSSFTVSNAWIYILGLAFGSKAFQRYGENADDPDDAAPAQAAAAPPAAAPQQPGNP